eukprot:TRINITY_DN107264_c0_g1_i1.p1 TRINITY_DN107264_c0_g1~~TRINITY_DN107264_c0_g1_i1.p1  ORF type:complete len:310 (-),score=40.30 TRINITY_DN107264_c0_g1_i1:82-1011(-)
MRLSISFVLLHDWIIGRTIAGNHASEHESISEVALQESLRVDEECAASLDGGAPASCALNALQHRGLEESEDEQHSGRNPRAINALQWNPRWECFVRTPKTCGQGATRALNGMLRSGFLDFANLVMWADESYRPPAQYSMLKEKCGRDVVVLLYDHARWRPSGTHKVLCLQGKDRPAIVQVFTKTTGPFLGLSVMVIGAHLPHPQHGDLGTLQGTIASWDGKVLFMGDTNRISSGKSLWCELSPKSCSRVVSSQLHNSCCKNTNFLYKGFDRILANFGTDLQSRTTFESVAKLSTGEFHIGVVGTLTVG